MPLLETTSCSKGTMGLSHGLDFYSLSPKQKNRWLFRIPGVCTDGVKTLPPKSMGRPKLNFTEIGFQHLNEKIYYPTTAEFQTMELSLYEVRCSDSSTLHPVINWINQIFTIINYSQTRLEQDMNFLLPLVNDFKKQSAQLELYDGCGNIVESWNYEGIYPVNVDFDNLDMATGDILMVNLTLRYDRAYMVGQNLPDGGDPFIGSGGQNTSRPLPLLGGGQTQF